MKFILILLLFIGSLTISLSIVQIKLTKSTAKYHNQYLLSLKFKQLSNNNSNYKQTSFLEKDVTLHQQV
jgi:hypothetical protein